MAINHEYVDRGYGIVEKRERDRADSGRIRLPSGRSFLLREPDPAFLSRQARRVREDFSQLTQVCFEVICEACVSPRFSMTPKRQAGELHPSEIDQGDQGVIVIYSLLSQVAAAERKETT